MDVIISGFTALWWHRADPAGSSRLLVPSGLLAHPKGGGTSMDIYVDSLLPRGEKHSAEECTQ